MSIKFHLPDFVRHFRLNVLLAEMLKRDPQYFHDDVTIGSVYGVFPPSMWNGGRLFGGGIEPKAIPGIIDHFNKRGIPVRFTFTNPMLKEEHLSDPFCNECMKIADNGMNEVIVVSPILEEYIRATYPSYKITSSTCKQIEQFDDLSAELSKDYSLVVLDYNLNNKYDELEKLPHKEKCEFLINASCIPACKKRKEHYKNIGEMQIKIAEYMRNKDKMTPPEYMEFDCPYMKQPLYQTTGYSTHIKPEDIYSKYVPMGFENFKMEGRSTTDIGMAENYIYYMVKPEYRDKARLHLLTMLTEGHPYFN